MLRTGALAGQVRQEQQQDVSLLFVWDVVAIVRLVEWLPNVQRVVVASAAGAPSHWLGLFQALLEEEVQGIGGCVLWWLMTASSATPPTGALAGQVRSGEGTLAVLYHSTALLLCGRSIDCRVCRAMCSRCLCAAAAV